MAEIRRSVCLKIPEDFVRLIFQDGFWVSQIVILICRPNIWRWVRPPLHAHTKEATCWLWVATCNVWRRVPCGLAVLKPLNEVVKWLAILYFRSYWVDSRSERPNSTNQLFMSSQSTYIIVQTVFFKLLLQQKIPKHFFFYLKSARDLWLWVTCVDITIFESI